MTDRDRGTPNPPYESILFERDADALQTDAAQEPECFGDLHLDRILASLTAGREEYRLEPLFHAPLRDVRAVAYRHEVLGDLEREDVLAAVGAFARGMQRMREQLALAQRLRNGHQRRRWFLESASTYCDVVSSFAQRLDELQLGSPGFRGLCGHLRDYCASERFTSLADETRERVDELATIGYAIHIKGNRVRVGHCDDEPDISADVRDTFAKFREGDGADPRGGPRGHVEVDRVEEQILERVIRLHPQTFARLQDHCARHRDYLDETTARFDREVQLYLAYLQYIEPLKRSGLAFSLPQVSTESRREHARETFDLALATTLQTESRRVVVNDFQLSDPERLLVITGPNNGGKTTFARMFGQLHHLAALGLPVPGVDVRLFLPDAIYTHFEREEEIETLRGRFEDELHRIHAILRRATGASVLVMNESFASTTLADALAVGSEVVSQIIALGALGVFVTFVDELASLDPNTVSMMSTVAPDDPAVRTHRVIRKPADGLAYAAAIADKHRLSYAALRRRIAR